jgi:hypothetical protein
VLLKTFARKLTGCATGTTAPLNSSARTTYTLRNNFAATGINAMKRLSGDQTNGRSGLIGGLSKVPFANTRSCFVSTFNTRSSLPARSKASIRPSGEKRGVASACASRVNCVSVFVPKS